MPPKHSVYECTQRLDEANWWKVFQVEGFSITSHLAQAFGWYQKAHKLPAPTDPMRSDSAYAAAHAWLAICLGAFLKMRATRRP